MGNGDGDSDGDGDGDGRIPLQAHARELARHQICLGI